MHDWNPYGELLNHETRRQFFRRGGIGFGAAALNWLLQADSSRAGEAVRPVSAPHFAPRAKRAIYLFMAGAPSQMDLLDYKPKMADWFNRDLPDSVRRGQRLTTMTSVQNRFPIAPSIYRFAKHGATGTWVSELLPHTAEIVDDLAIVKSMHNCPVKRVWARGSVTGWEALIKNCLRSSCSPRPGRAARTPRHFTIACGAADSCPPNIKALRCDRSAIRFCSCPTPPASRRPPDGG